MTFCKNLTLNESLEKNIKLNFWYETLWSLLWCRKVCFKYVSFGVTRMPRKMQITIFSGQWCSSITTSKNTFSFTPKKCDRILNKNGAPNRLSRFRVLLTKNRPFTISTNQEKTNMMNLLNTITKWIL